MAKIRVLIVDDSVVVRRMLTDVLSAEADFEVIGAAATAGLALAKLDQSTPDVITLDVELPDMSGLDLLAKIRQRWPRLPVIMFSSLTRKAAVTTLEALARGASDYVPKPEQTGSRDETIAQIKVQLVPKIRAFAPVSAQPWLAPPPPVVTRPRESAVRELSAVSILAIGCSTGGPNALAELFAQLPGDLPVPVVVVQHMPPLFTRLLAERLDAAGPLRFHEGADGVELEAGHVYIAPGDHHMRVVAQVAGKPRLALDQGTPENSCRPAVDPLFRSVVRIYGARTLAVILTGMGQDGLRGVEDVRTAGGQIVAQDEATSVVWGMPGFVVRAGLADVVLPLGAIAGELVRRITRTTAATDRSTLSHVG